jgi:PAS domain S-box-containing protein
VDRVLGNYPMIALCTYSLDKCNANEIIDVVSNHQFVLIKREGKWEQIESLKRKQAEEELRQATEHERFLADVVENANMPFGVGAPDGRLLMFNQAFVDLTGYSREELIQKQMTWATDLTPPEWREDEAACLAEALRTRQPVRYEKEYLRKDGMRVPIELFVQPMFDTAGNLLHYRSFLTDITERKQAEEALRESEEKYATVFDKSPFAITLTRMLEGIVTGVNDAFLRLFEYTREEVIGKTSIDLGITDSVSRSQVAEELEARGSVHDFECTRTTRSSMQLTLSLNLDCVSIGGKKHILTTIQDITERRQADKALRESEAKYRDVFETVQEVFYLDRLIYDEQGNVVDWIFEDLNQAGFELLGLKDIDEARGKRGSEVLGHEVASFYLPMIEKARQSNKAVTFQYYSPYVDREFLTTYIVRSDRLISAQTDITEIKQAEKALQESEAKYRKLFMNMTEEVHFWKLVRDEDGQIQTWRLVDANPPALKTWGKTLEEIEDKTTDDIFGPGATEHYMPVVRKIMNEGVPYVFEDYFPHLDKHFRFTDSVP